MGISAALIVAATFFVLREARDEREERILAAHQHIEELRNLVTARYRYRDVVYLEQETRVLGIPTSAREILFSVDIGVEAGVDLSRDIKVVFDPNDRRGVFVTLPSPQVLRVDADEETIRQYIVRERFARLDWLDVAEEVEAAKERNRLDAIERGILIRAEAQARSALESLLRGLGFEKVHIRFRSEDAGLRG